MIVRRSRYEGAPLVGIDDVDGRRKVWVGPRRKLALTDRDAGAQARVVLARSEEPLDLMSLRELGRERLWWLIADMNPDLADFEVLVEAILNPGTGTRVLVPDRRDTASL